MKKVLVTGGAGFIGSGVVRNLLDRGITPVVLDRHAVEPRTDGAEVILGDVRDKSVVSEAVYASDGVIHLAAILGTQETIRRADEVVTNNIVGSLNVFDAVLGHDKPAVYIAVGNHWMNNPYSITKTAAERFALMYNKERGTRIAVVRGLNVYGPGQKVGPVRKVVPNFVVPALQARPITVYGDGTQIMDMIYIDDMATVLVKALHADLPDYGKVIEAGWGIDTTVNDLAEAVIDEVGVGVIDHVPMRPGEIPNSVVKADASTLKVLGLVPKRHFVPLEEGIKRTVAYYREFLG